MLTLLKFKLCDVDFKFQQEPRIINKTFRYLNIIVSGMQWSKGVDLGGTQGTRPSQYLEYTQIKIKVAEDFYYDKITDIYTIIYTKKKKI